VSRETPRAGIDYPRTYGELLAWFPDDAACLDYLEWLRWPEGFVCPACETGKGWRTADGRWSCAGCARLVSATAGTIFHGTRTPLTIWFLAAWHVVTQKNGASALGLKRVLGLGSEQTAWAMLHRFRTAMGRTSADLLSGSVEVDETYVGGPEPGRDGRGALGKTLVGVAVEVRGTALGRCRLAVLEDAGRRSLRRFLVERVAPGATVVTDGWPAYPTATAGLYNHEQIVLRGSGADAHEVLPRVHRVASLVKRWLLGTHQGGVKPGHLPAYLDEFTFRFNRRRSRSRGLLFYRLLSGAVVASPRTYRSLVVGHPTSRVRMPAPPSGSRVRDGGLAPMTTGRPWRQVRP
jgi:transposase-like protein